MKFLKNKKLACFLWTAVFSSILVFRWAETAYASDTDRGWYVQDDIYGSGSSTSGSGAVEGTDEIGVVERWVAEMIYNLGNSIDATILSSGTIDLSIDGIIMGRVGGANPSYAQFDLARGNPYGIIGAWMFVAFRTMAFSFFLIYFVLYLIPQFFREGNKGRAELKEFIPKVIFYYFMLFAFPYLVDYFIYGRDVLMKDALQVVRGGIIGDAGVGTSLLSVYVKLYEERMSIMNAFLYLATVVAGLFFFTDYLGTALIETACFGAAPMVFLLAPRNKKLVEGWANTFFMNLLIPLIDSLLILIPSFILYIYNDNRNAAGLAQASLDTPDVGGAAIYTIVLLCIFAIRPSRNGILRALGVFTGATPKTGMGGLLGMAGMGLMALARRGGSSASKGNDSGDSLKGDIQEARDAKSENEALQAANSRNDGSGDINDVLGNRGDSGKLDDEMENVGSGDNRSDNEKVDDFVNEGPDGEPGAEDIRGDGTLESVEEDADIVRDESETFNDGDADTSNGPSMEEQAVLDAQEQMSSDTSRTGNWMDQSEYYDSNFASELSGSDSDRYANLAARDEMQSRMQNNSESIMANNDAIASGESTIARNKAEIAQIDSEISGMGADFKERQNEIAKLEAANSSIEKELGARASGKPGTLSGGNAALRRQQEINSARIEELQGGNAAYQEKLDRKTALAQQNASIQSSNAQRTAQNAKLQLQNQSLSSGIERATIRERNYAANAQAVGMSGKTYSSASGFQQQSVIDINRRKQMNYRNFDSAKFEGLVSPEQRVKYARQRAVMGTATKVVSTTAKVAAAAAVGSVGAAAMAYGGPSAMQKGAMGAIVGGAVVTKVGTSAVSTGAVVTQEAGKAVARAIDKRLVGNLGPVKKGVEKPTVTSKKTSPVKKPESGVQADFNRTFEEAKKAADDAMK